MLRNWYSMHLCDGIGCIEVTWVESNCPMFGSIESLLIIAQWGWVRQTVFVRKCASCEVCLLRIYWALLDVRLMIKYIEKRKTISWAIQSILGRAGFRGQGGCAPLPKLELLPCLNNMNLACFIPIYATFVGHWSIFFQFCTFKFSRSPPLPPIFRWRRVGCLGVWSYFTSSFNCLVSFERMRSNEDVIKAKVVALFSLNVSCAVCQIGF